MKVIVFGSSGLVGSSLIRGLSQNNTIKELLASNRSKTNLFSFEETYNLISSFKPDLIINAAAKVGGILANNTLRSEFLIENLKINLNIIESIIDFPNIRLINLGSSCIYPLNSPNPIKEESLMEGKLEPTNSPYAMAKLTAIELGNALNIQFGHNVLNLMPTNLYGPHDNFSLEHSHVIPGLISRMHNAKQLEESQFNVWGTGKAKREFLHVDDLTGAIQFLIKNEIFNGLFNIGSNEEVTISDLSYKIKNIVNYKGKINFDTKLPDGNMQKLLDSTKINNLGWKPKISLEEGLNSTYEWYKINY